MRMLSSSVGRMTHYQQWAPASVPLGFFKSEISFQGCGGERSTGGSVLPPNGDTELVA